MKNNFIITVTNNIEGCPIEKYIDSICTNVVVGTNIFSDFAAAISDFLGGFSGSYKKKLELIYREATKELKEKAKSLGANAIIGFSIDFDEVSGAGKSMFMVSASGTACKVKYPDDNFEETSKSEFVTQDFIDFEIVRRYIIKSINSGSAIKSDFIEFLYEFPQKEIAKNLINRYLLDYTDNNDKKFIERYLTLLPKSDIIDNIYSLYPENDKKIGTLIKRCKLFSPKHILYIAKSNIHLAIDLLDSRKEFYQKDDLVLMKEIINLIEKLPDTGKIEMVKGGLLSKEQEKYICENGHKNDKETVFCETCDVNIKGLSKNEVAIIEQLKEIIDILEDNL